MLLRRREFTSNPQIYHHRRVYRKAIPTLIDVLSSTPLFVERDRFVLLRRHCYLMLVLLVALYSAISEPEWKLSVPWTIIAMYQPWSSRMRTKFFFERMASILFIKLVPSNITIFQRNKPNDFSKSLKEVRYIGHEDTRSKDIRSCKMDWKKAHTWGAMLNDRYVFIIGSSYGIERKRHFVPKSLERHHIMRIKLWIVNKHFFTVKPSELG